MPRKPLSPAEAVGPEFVGATPPEFAEQDQRVARDLQVAALATSPALLVGQRMGRRQIISALSKLLAVTDLVDLQRIKDSKGYRGMTFPLPDGNTVTLDTWDQYCEHVEGRSRQSVDLDLSNLERFGPELFAALREIGIGPGKMREIRAVEQDDATKLLECAKAGDKEGLLDIAQTLITRHQVEREQLSKKAERAEQEAKKLLEDVEEKRALLAEKDEKLAELRKNRRKIERSGARVQADELLAEMDAAAIEAASAIKRLRDNVSAIQATYEDAGETLDEEVAGRIEQNLQLAQGWAQQLAEELDAV